MGSGKKSLVQRGRSSVTGPLGNGQQYYINRGVDVVDRAEERVESGDWGRPRDATEGWWTSVGGGAGGGE
jgi:hypothetical protein